jgi:hypothetical protein
MMTMHFLTNNNEHNIIICQNNIIKQYHYNNEEFRFRRVFPPQVVALSAVWLITDLWPNGRDLKHVGFSPRYHLVGPAHWRRERCLLRRTRLGQPDWGWSPDLRPRLVYRQGTAGSSRFVDQFWVDFELSCATFGLPRESQCAHMYSSAGQVLSTTSRRASQSFLRWECLCPTPSVRHDLPSCIS